MLRWIVLAHLLSRLMISPYLAHIHITSQTFTVSSLPSGFTSGLIRSCITCVIRTDKALLNGQTSHGRNIRHIFFEPKVLCSYRRRSIMQCNMCNQCSGLFTCIMDYLHVLCMILMVLSCVLCMTLIVFIYMYYGLFTCTNLVDVMSLFFTVFSFHLSNFGINQPVSSKNRPVLAMPVFGKTGRFISQTGYISVFLVFTVPPSSPVRFSRFSPIFSEFLKNRWDR
jgi:hypothetical protein